MHEMNLFFIVIVFNRLIASAGNQCGTPVFALLMRRRGKMHEMNLFFIDLIAFAGNEFCRTSRQRNSKLVSYLF